MFRDRVEDALKDPLVSKAGILEVHPEVQLAYMKRSQGISLAAARALISKGGFGPT